MSTTSQLLSLSVLILLTATLFGFQAFSVLELEDILRKAFVDPINLINPIRRTSPITKTSSSAMAWLCTGRNNAELITNLASAGLITSDRVRKAMLGVDRAHYSRVAPYTDSPQTIGYSATISAPHMHASAAESLLPFLHPAARVLDIGSGSGYLTHVLANLLDSDEGKVIGIDHIDGLVDLAKSNMAKSDDGRKMLERKKVEFITGDGRKGFPDKGPYDAIHVGAAAKELHVELVKQLRAPGRMFIPVGGNGEMQWIWVVDKDEKGEVKKTKDMGVRYVPLTDAPKGRGGE